MRKKLRIFSLALLLLLGSSANGGGWMLIKDPTGSSMQLPMAMLDQTPFNNYLIPGIILLVTVGFLSISSALLAAKVVTNYELFVIFQGCILTWLTAELILNIEYFHPLYHIPLYIISLLLIIKGLRIKLSVQEDFNVKEVYI